MILTGGNRNDITQLMPPIDAIPPIRGRVGHPRRKPNSLFADRGYDHLTSARAALAELQTEANFELFRSNTVSAHQLWDIWSWRHKVMLETGLTPRLGLADAIDRLRAAGTARIYLGTITGSQRRSTVFLAEDLTRCVACM